MCDHQRQQFWDGVTMPCADPDCIFGDNSGTLRNVDEPVGVIYTRECYLPAPDGTPAFYFWLRRDA